MDFFFDNLVLIIIAFISGALLIWPLVTKGIGLKKIGTLEATQLLNSKNAVLIDLREDNNLSLGIIPQSIRIPQSKFETTFSSYEKKLTDSAKKTKKPIILVSDDNKSFSKIEKFFESRGFQEVYALDGGVNAWVEAGFPIKK